MIDGFRTDNELLAQRAEAFAALGERASQIASDLRSGVESHGECWGHDEIGSAFAAGHVEQASATMRQVGRLPGGLTDVGERLGATAATYAESEQTSETAMHGVDR